MKAKKAEPKKAYHSSKASKQQPFLKAYKRYGTIGHACIAVHISRDLVADWRHHDDKFEKEFQSADETLTEKLEKSAYDRAMGGDTTLTIFLLKARKPSMYTEKFKHDVRAGTLTEWLAQDHDEQISIPAKGT